MSLQPSIHSCFQDAVLYPKLFKLQDNLYAASFFLMKLLPAKFILDNARKEGKIRPGSTIAETTSGTFGLALAMLCNHYGYKCILVSDPVLDPLLKNRIESLGAVVDIVAEPSKVGGYQRARLDRLNEHLDKHKDSFWPMQYENHNNPSSYALLAEYFATALGKIDCLIGTVGSGGSMCGTSLFLRKVNPDMQAIGVDTINSILFGQPDGKRLVRGLGNSIMPAILDHTIFDEVHWLSAEETFAATRNIHKQHGLFVGATGGAAYKVAKHWADRHPKLTTVFICADEGYRYLDNVFDDNWVDAQNLNLNRAFPEPLITSSPLKEMKQWTMMDWGRRTLQEVIQANRSNVEVMA
ncbi:cysteine synthase family protein [Sulfuriferula nivalis]|uniref:Cystathionine beta-synthase n=1 Tax=Sulfuriferula nivalis TaxID=2675298 RepID=A0A809RM80_9PROT|nr:cysteine synthase family protein [Sulfuriferula nivalis]BBP02515.1 cystathionine beta-synthase [Sulfuriferula nivalis]